MCIRDSKCYIVRGTRLWISHDLLVKKGTKLEDIHTIISHPQALGQCSHFLEKLEGVELRSFDNTARAAPVSYTHLIVSFFLDIFNIDGRD